MECCNKLIVDKTFMIHQSWRCQKPIYKDGLCAKHYKRKISKAIPFKDREGYRQPTVDEMKSGKILRLAKLGSHGVFRYVKGIIVNYATHKPTKLPLNPELFVIKLP